MDKKDETISVATKAPETQATDKKKAEPSSGAPKAPKTQTIDKKRAASKDRLTTLESKIDRLELNIKESRESADVVNDRLGEIEASIEPIKDEVTEEV